MPVSGTALPYFSFEASMEKPITLPLAIKCSRFDSQYISGSGITVSRQLDEGYTCRHFVPGDASCVTPICGLTAVSITPATFATRNDAAREAFSPLRSGVAETQSVFCVARRCGGEAH